MSASWTGSRLARLLSLPASVPIADYQCTINVATMIVISLLTFFILLDDNFVQSGFPSFGNVTPKGPPVVIIPGLQASNLDFRLKPNYTDHWMTAKCEKLLQMDWYPIWMNPEFITPGRVPCLEYIMRLHYNSTDHKTYNSPGIEIRPAGHFGDPKGIEYFTHPPQIFPYMGPLLSYMEFYGQYKKGRTVLAGQYDWRKAPNELGDYFLKLRKLIEDTHDKNNDKRVVLLGQSMGGLYATFFLNKMSQKWKDKYIKRLITVSAPFGGSVAVCLAFTKGFGPEFVPYGKETIRAVETSFPSIVYLLPNRYGYDEDEVLVQVVNEKITVETMTKFLLDNDEFSLPLIFEDLEGTTSFHHPGVNVSCLYTIGRKTPMKLVFKRPEDVPNNPKIIKGEGDGIVNLKSLAHCNTWANRHRYDLRVKVLKGAWEHSAFIGSFPAIKIIFDMIVQA